MLLFQNVVLLCQPPPPCAHSYTVPLMCLHITESAEIMGSGYTSFGKTDHWRKSEFVGKLVFIYNTDNSEKM